MNGNMLGTFKYLDGAFRIQCGAFDISQPQQSGLRKRGGVNANEIL